MRFFVFCPAHLATGGTELLHQLCSHLNDLGIENYMVYTNCITHKCPTPNTFYKYNVKYVTQYIDAPDSVMVLPETQIHNISLCNKGLIVVWWLSVDNYFSAYPGLVNNNNIDPFNMKSKINILHFVQSNYAGTFLSTKLKISKYYYLSDYINDDIISIAASESLKRKNICLYNPRKGYENIEPIMKACRNDIQWVPLSGLSPTALAQIMCLSKVYIDFGSHPGKDRIPREAACCGCCIITNKLGSAANSTDICIDEKYKISDMKNINLVLETIYDLIDNYEVRQNDFTIYREKILSEKSTFFAEISNAISIVHKVLQSGNNNQSNISLEQINHIEEILKSLSYISKELSEQLDSCNSSDSSDIISHILQANYLLLLQEEVIDACISNF